MTLGELIDFCARSVALGIPESTKLRAIANDSTELLAVFAETRTATSLDTTEPVGADDGVIIEGGVRFDIPDEE